MNKGTQLKNLIHKPYVYFLLFIILVGANPSIFSPNSPYTTNVSRRFEPPSTAYFFGTDELGRCVFSRVMYGARISLATGLSILLLSLFCGGLLGTLAGYFGGWLDEVIMRLTDIFMTIPSNVETAKIIGLKRSYILIKHILPGVLPPILVMATLGMARNILMTSSLSFLGLGIIEPTPDWGAMLNKGTTYIRTAPHIALFSGLIISLTILSFNLLGDALGHTEHRKFFLRGLRGLK